MKGIQVLFENEEILVLDKPSGLAVQGGAGLGISLDVLLARERSPAPLLLHRLDRDTSGVILTAKTRAAAGKYAGLLRSGAFSKRYLALCSGFAPEKGLLREALRIRGRIKTAETRYTCLCRGKPVFPAAAALPAGPAAVCSLLELETGTGRMHQIRRHLAGSGLPILGDDKYGDFTLNKALRRALGLRRLLLHASSLSFPLDPSGPACTVSAPLPAYWTPLLDAAGIRPDARHGWRCNEALGGVLAGQNSKLKIGMDADF